jgi:chaperone required for assembly of F1-ATPase
LGARGLGRRLRTDGRGLYRAVGDALAAASAAIPRAPWQLGALHSVTTLTGSALIALALMRGALSLDAAWSAAHVDEDWIWALGPRRAALERRTARFAEMQSAVTVLAATEQSGAQVG